MRPRQPDDDEPSTEGITNGLGLVGAFGVGGGRDELHRLVAERYAQQMQQAQLERQLQGDARAERQLRLSEETTRQNSESLREQREMLADQRRQNMAHVMAGDLAPGDSLDPQQAATLRAGNLGSNIEHQQAVLPSRTRAGYATALGTTTPSPGFLRTVSTLVRLNVTCIAARRHSDARRSSSGNSSSGSTRYQRTVLSGWRWSIRP